MTLRPAELLAALALHPDGLTAERLAMLLYGDDGNPTTVRGEVLRLRSLIGADVLRTRPYRLDATVDTDFGTVRRALRPGKPAEALRACAGPLLPRSDAPEIREERDALVAGLRRAVLAADETDLLADYASHPLGRDDLEVHERLLVRMAHARPPPPALRGPPRPPPRRRRLTRPPSAVPALDRASRHVRQRESRELGRFWRSESQRSGARSTQCPKPDIRSPFPADSRVPGPARGYSTVTLLARLRGLSTSRSSATAAW